MFTLEFDTDIQYLQHQLDRSMNRLYRRFLMGDVEPLDFSEHLDELIEFYAPEDVPDAPQYCKLSA